MPKRFWSIRGYDSTETIYERVVPFGCLSERQVIALLQRLASRHLDEDEVTDSSLKRNSKAYRALLEPHCDVVNATRVMISVGENPYYVASVWEQQD